MVEVIFAPPEERHAIAQFMQDAFPRAKWSFSGWQTLLSGRWCGPDGRYAIIAKDKSRIVGVLGLVTSMRPTASGPKPMANMTSWYVLQAYRGQGLGHRMIELACMDPETTVTNFTSSAKAVHVVESAGLAILDAERNVWRKRDGDPVLSVRDGPSLGGLPDHSKQILKDHKGLRLAPYVVETPDGPVMLLISKQRRTDSYENWEIYHLSDRTIFAAHDRAIANSVLPETEAVLSADSRLVAGATHMDAIEPLAVPRFYSAGRMAPEDVDPLYSEVILLDMKLS